MLKLYNNFFMTINLFSRIPSPNIKREKENFKYVTIFFPFIGTLIGIMILYAYYILKMTSINKFFITVLISFIPVFITGGYHINGFTNTIDAVFSYGNVEKKRKILREPYVGSRGMMYANIYFLLFIGIFMDISYRSINYIIIIMTLSRILCSFMILNFRFYDIDNMHYILKNNASKRVCNFILTIYLIIIFIYSLSISYVTTLALTSTCITIYLYQYLLTYKEFDGISSDLCGFFISITELLMIFVAVFISKTGLF